MGLTQELVAIQREIYLPVATRGNFAETRLAATSGIPSIGMVFGAGAYVEMPQLESCGCDDLLSSQGDEETQLPRMLRSGRGHQARAD